MRTVKTAALLTVSLSIFGGLTALSPDPALATTQCTAGNVSTTENGNVRIVTFSAPNSGNGTCTWEVPANVFVVDYLVVAGGGGGGSGGGGGGGVVTTWDQASANPMTVEPGTDIDVTVGAGGDGGAGGSDRYSAGAPNTALHRDAPQSGNDSVFGSVVANGGGAGGHFRLDDQANFPGNGIAGGSSGGSSFDNTNNNAVDPNTSTVVGAVSFGNAGGANPGSGGYRAGAGGGGAGAAGGSTVRNTDGEGSEGGSTNRRGGGAGGGGISIAITGTAQTFGCGGGGGVNSNLSRAITGGGGAAGCASAGRGSRFALFRTNDTVPNNYADFGATNGSANFGGGGGGTDPEDFRGGSGGSGIVIIRYTLVDSRCPNNGTNTATTPLACPTDITIQADGASTNVAVLGSPISFSSGGTLSVRSRPTANPTSGNMSATASGSNIVISVPSGSSLIGGRYPVVYRITQGASTSDSYILVRVEDPTQLTPGTIPLDPRETGITFPRIELGAAPNVLVCMTLQDNNTDGLSLAATATTGVTIGNPSTRRITFSGTNASVESALNAVTITGSGTGILVPTNTTRVLDVNVTNTNNGGNGSCSVGTESTITLNKLSLTAGQRLRINLD